MQESMGVWSLGLSSDNSIHFKIFGPYFNSADGFDSKLRGQVYLVQSKFTAVIVRV